VSRSKLDIEIQLRNNKNFTSPQSFEGLHLNFKKNAG
jgi:hypothetical protein